MPVTKEQKAAVTDPLRAAANNISSENTLSLPAVPVLQKQDTGKAPVTQLKPATWVLRIGIKKAGQVAQKTFNIQYDDEADILVKDVKAQLENYNGENYKVMLVYLGTNNEFNNNLKDGNYALTPDRIRHVGANMLAVLEWMENEEKLENEKNAQKPRDPRIIKQAVLGTLIEKYGFVKIVTANHINSAGEPGAKKPESSVVEQQVSQIEGNTLFIDPFFLTPGKESQYHDILVSEGCPLVEQDGALGLYVIKGPNFLLGILRCMVYTDEVNELGVSVKHYIHENRPVDVIKE